MKRPLKSKWHRDCQTVKWDGAEITVSNLQSKMEENCIVVGIEGRGNITVACWAEGVMNNLSLLPPSVSTVLHNIMLSVFISLSPLSLPFIAAPATSCFC